jgi:hypothetical protein
MTQSIDQLLANMRAGGGVSRPLRSNSAGARRARRAKRQFRSWTYDSNEIPPQIMNEKNIFIGASDYGDYLYSQLLVIRGEKEKSTFSRELKLQGNRRRWFAFIEDEFIDEHIMEFNESGGMIINEDENFIRFDVNSNSINVRLYGDQNYITETSKMFLSEFDEVTSYIEWVYSPDGNSVTVPLNTERLPHQEMYPFLGEESLEDYYDRFLASPANILLLIGPPGTGKTTFIRGLLSHSNSSALVTYDAAILEKDYLFARFIEDETGVMVLEDSDTFLKARSDGNTMMHRFLNVGDGLVTTKGKKLIFSTNLPSIRDVDPALVRPGRCFDIVNFAPLNGEQATKLANKLGVNYETKASGTYSIAEIFNKQIENATSKKVGSKMGFI